MSHSEQTTPKNMSNNELRQARSVKVNEGKEEEEGIRNG